MKIVITLVLALQFLSAQNPNFNVSLRLDYASVDALLDFTDGKIANVNRVAELRGNQIAAVTSAMLARQPYSRQNFSAELERLRNGSGSGVDVYGLKTTAAFREQIRALLAEIKKRQLDRKVVATLEQFFPQNARINTSIPVYFVALGNDNAAAFVRRIVWQENTPVFVGEGEGELTIVMNLARSVQYIQEVQIQFVDMMSTLAHETFHAAFGVYQNTSPVWQNIHARVEPYWTLAELAQNEGIAYLISAQQRTGAHLSAAQLSSAKLAVGELNRALNELQSPSITPSRARELIMNSNLSGSYEKNYGATAGLLMAYSIDAKLGRTALMETLQKGVGDFFAKYQELTRQFGELPAFDDGVINSLNN